MHGDCVSVRLRAGLREDSFRCTSEVIAQLASNYRFCEIFAPSQSHTNKLARYRHRNVEEMFFFAFSFGLRFSPNAVRKIWMIIRFVSGQSIRNGANLLANRNRLTGEWIQAINAICHFLMNETISN